MKWSQLKKKVESNFATSLKGRVQIWNTRYRDSHDAEGEAWITVDKQRVWSMGTYAYIIAEKHEAERLCLQRGCTDYRDPDQSSGYREAWREARDNVHETGIFTMWEFNDALFEYLNTAIEEAIASANPIIRAFATLDRRFGKRRIERFDDSNEHSLVKTLFRIRYEAEGFKTA